MVPLVDRSRVRRVLDIGAGDVWLCARIRDDFPPDVAFTAWDVGYTEADLADLPRPRNVRLVRELDAQPYDVLLLFDVLEHVEDDVGFLAGLVSDHLEPGGYALITVPAQPWLFSNHDRQLRHFRRYSPRSIESVLSRAGLRVLESGGLFHTLVGPRAAIKLKDAWFPTLPRPHTLGWRGGRATRLTLATLLAADVWVSAHSRRLPWALPGTSWWAVCQKPSS